VVEALGHGARIAEELAGDPRPSLRAPQADPNDLAERLSSEEPEALETDDPRGAD
jgi:hypothetical protein